MRLSGKSEVLSSQQQNTLWERWSSLNVTARLDRLADPKVFAYFSELIQQLPAEQGPEARQQTLTLISRCVKPDGIEHLWNALRVPDPPGSGSRPA